MTVPVSERPYFSKAVRFAAHGATIPKRKAVKKSFCIIKKSVLGVEFARLVIKKPVSFAVRVPKTVRQVQEKLWDMSTLHKSYTTKSKKTLLFTAKKAASPFQAESV